MVAVRWVTYEPHTLARGYYDQALLEDLLAGHLWQPPHAYTFEHHEHDWPDTDGCVVVVPGRHNARHCTQLNRDTARYAWVLYVFTGDEDAEFPWPALTHPRARVWAQGARHDRHLGVHVPLGSGYAPETRPYLATKTDLEFVDQRPLDWVFTGQVTHVRREQMAMSARLIDNGKLHGTDRFAAHLSGGGVTHEVFLDHLCDAKVAPCPSGPCSPDSFRLYEALECGAIPIADAQTPAVLMDEYWAYVFGTDPPFPLMYHWDGLPGLVPELVEGWPANANTVHAWWLLEKRRLAYRLRDDIAMLTDQAGSPSPGTPDEQITVVVPCSPSPTNPSLDIIDETIESVRQHLGYAEIIVTCDPPRPELEATHGRAWDRFISRVCWAAHHRWHNVAVLLRPTWGHQANVVRDAMALVTTPYVLLVEYDAPLSDRVIEWEECLAMLESGQANIVRFYHDGPDVHPDHAHLMLGPPEDPIGAAPTPGFVRTVQYSARPHLAPAWWYRDMLDRHFPLDSRTMIEDVLHGIIQNNGKAGWPQWRIWIYHDTRPDNNIQRSYHLDGRHGDPKFAMTLHWQPPDEPDE